MDLGLQGKIILVTGGGLGIGAAIIASLRCRGRSARHRQQ